MNKLESDGDSGQRWQWTWGSWYRTDETHKMVVEYSATRQVSWLDSYISSASFYTPYYRSLTHVFLWIHCNLHHRIGFTHFTLLLNLLWWPANTADNTLVRNIVYKIFWQVKYKTGFQFNLYPNYSFFQHFALSGNS